MAAVLCRVGLARAQEFNATGNTDPKHKAPHWHKGEVVVTFDANIETLAGNVTYTRDDRTLLAEFAVKALDSDAIKRMRVD